jgi:hypothetical protein
MKFEFPLEFGEKEYIVHFTATFGRSGIGSYEFWGQKCYDRGQIELEELTFEERDLPKDVIAYLEEAFDGSNWVDSEDPFVRAVVDEAHEVYSSAGSMDFDED